jgi:hypothetical protein
VSNLELSLHTCKIKAIAFPWQIDQDNLVENVKPILEYMAVSMFMQNSYSMLYTTVIDQDNLVENQLICQ